LARVFALLKPALGWSLGLISETAVIDWAVCGFSCRKPQPQLKPFCGLVRMVFMHWRMSVHIDY